MDFGTFTPYILASYALTFVVILGLLGASFVSYRNAKRTSDTSNDQKI